MMRRYLVIGFGLLLGLSAIWAGEAADTQPAEGSYPDLKPEDRSAKAREALDPATGDEARYKAVCALASGEYRPESAEALAVIASGSKYNAVLRWNAAEGLRGSAHCMPEAVREPIRRKLRDAVRTEQEKLPNGPLRVLLLWGDADWVMETLGNKLRGRPEEIEVLSRISSRDRALTRLWELYQYAADSNTFSDSEWIKRRYIGMTMTNLRDKRGIDILLECLTTKEPWDGLGQAHTKEVAAAFRENLHGTFGLIAAPLHNDFGYDTGGRWKPQLAEAIPKMVQWWKANREKWSFEEATSTELPKIEEGKALTKRQARVLAAKLANDAFANQTFKHPGGGKPVGKIEIDPESFNVSQKDGRWVLRIVRSAGPEAFVDFALDGSAPKVVVNYAWD
jgi:hypothetical protein